ncbi:MAG TPA: SPOR domain-containing protein [Noviherbaspirillum sp.]|jgi:cell division protein FtsN|uniref:SPOR domain-containing protein n=1 Tax=Noviherbaspirillum sp. TaxID=1926288 RepID=UPI002F9242CC
MIKYNRQQGGTFLGIIIGLVIGLGIALAVAMAITKTPMPFTDKSGRQKATEPTAGQAADPNRPLYGNRAARETRDAPKEAPKEVAPPENTAAPQPADKSREVQVGGKLDQKQGDKAPVVEQSAKAKAADSGDDKWIYFLQAGAFREQNDAEGMRAKLALQGVEAKVSERQSESGVLYRVRVGPFNEIDAMNKVRGKLSDSGIDAAVVRAAK